MVEKAVLGDLAARAAVVSDRPAAYPPRRLLVLVSKGPGQAPGQRFRLEQWAPRLARDHGITLKFSAFESPRLSEILYRRGHVAAKAALMLQDFARRARSVIDAGEFDAIIIYREAALIGPAIYERLLAARKPLIYDFDDSIWHSLASANGLFSRLRFVRKTSSICRMAAAVTPGNSFLADYALQRNPDTFVVPTSIELDDYPLLPEPPSDTPFVVCWTGSTSTLVHFEHARESLEMLAAKLPLVVKVICNQPPERPIAGAEMRFVRWSAEGEAREVGDCHAGIMPLPDDALTRGKCGLKALQYMATGRPVVISPVGMNRDLIQSGVNGVLATTPAEMVDGLMKLARSPDLRARIGANARRTIEQDYSARVVAARFAATVRFVTDGGPRPQPNG